MPTNTTNNPNTNKKKGGYDPDQLERAAMMGGAPTTTRAVEPPAVAMVPPSVARLQQQQQQQQQANTSFAQRFLQDDDDDDEDADLVMPPPPPSATKTTPMRTRSNPRTDLVDSTAASSNLFQPRHEFYSVDQSVNLMDAEVGSYEQQEQQQQRASNTGGFGHQSLVDIFFHEDHDPESADVVDMKGKHHHARKRFGGSTANRIQEVCCNPYVIAVVVLLAVLPVVILVSSGNANNTNTTTTTGAATTSTMPPAPQVTSEETMTTTHAPVHANAKTRLDALQTLVLDHGLSLVKDVDDLTSATLQALHWMAERDTYYDVTNTTTMTTDTVQQILQRYTLAVLYHAVHNDQVDDEPPDHVGQRRRRKLQGATYAPVSDELAQWADQNHKKFRTTWLQPTTHVCTWFGVTCHEDATKKITHVDLPNCLLQGTLPRELVVAGTKVLSELVQLDLAYNHMQGALPDVGANDPTTGTAHHGWPKLERLRLHHNEFTGALPGHTLESLTSLVELDLSFNQFAGHLPNLGTQALPNIREIYLDDNRLTGPPMDTFLFVPHIQHLSLSKNQLSGSIPATIQKLTHLKQLKLSENRLTGQLPDSMGKLVALEKLILMKNGFAGTLPAPWSALTNLTTLKLELTNVQGTVPTEWSALTGLETLLLHETSLTGEIPPQVCALTTQDEHRLKTFLTDCLSAEIQCDCCSDCF